ncbi:4-hydroxy-tetrahydrodipicolinate synthase [Thalassotalea sp. M1531]|uniref:4-hydroxy-tetrahydrodipicolinate synthase n=2 Tax=Thalassotalea algicola TaxID=2716224 RepID=A0A7Y0LC13_9GAMM|nr:4-hydroxy-tetrahydrodipicolinate synthase [Thalassotalea algicola]
MNPESSYNLAEYPLWTALVTPFTDSGEIDFASLSRIARQQSAAGNGLLILGSTGEALSLSAEQQFGIIQYITELSLNVPIMLGVGGYQLIQQLEWIERCNELAIDAYLLGAPLYAKPGPVGQEQWFTALLNASNKPCMLYNVPSRSGVSLSVSTLANLQHHEKCWALKEASADIEQFLQYRNACPELHLFSGEDALMPYLATAGASGLVSVSANAWPEATHLYVRQCLDSATDNVFPVWHQSIAALFTVANPIPVKVLMHENGDIDTPFLQPPLTHHEIIDKQALFDANDAIHSWYWAQIESSKQRA